MELEATDITELELTTELLTLDATELGATELVVPPEQTAPLMVGFSADEPPLVPCTPKLTD